MKIIKKPDTILLQPCEVEAALADAIKRQTGRDLQHIVKVLVHEAGEVGSLEVRQLLTLSVSLRDPE